jgi:NAD(P)-dependent dehydrogenase (short-subunit alcohol dehydrogenase family)
MAAGGRSVYAASKAAVEAFARSQSIDLGPRGFTVNAVAPGTTDTGKLPAEMAGKARTITALGAGSVGPTSSPPLSPSSNAGPCSLRGYIERLSLLFAPGMVPAPLNRRFLLPRRNPATRSIWLVRTCFPHSSCRTRVGPEQA